MSMSFQKQYGSQYEFRFFGEAAPDSARKLSLTPMFDNGIMRSIRLVVAADMTNPWNKGIKVQASRNAAASLIRASRANRSEVA